MKGQLRLCFLLCLLLLLLGESLGQEESSGSEEETGGTYDDKRKKEASNFKKFEFVSSMKNYSRATGEPLKLKCEVTGGDPKTEVVFRWFLNEAPLEEEKGRIKVKDSVQGDPKWSRIRFRDLEVMDTGIYR